MNKKICCFLVFCIMFSLGFSAFAEDVVADPSTPPNIRASAAILLNLDTGETVYDKNAGVKMFPASTVKIMTGILAVEFFQDYEQEIIVSESSVSNITGNNIEAMADEIFTVDNLLYALIMNSANDAASILAFHIAGSVEEFVIKMNEKAIALGCTNTVFTNPSGLHNETMVTTASDMAKIAAYAFTLNKFMAVSNTPAYTIPSTNKTTKPRTLYNKNHLVSKAQKPGYFYEYAQGMNSGSTAEGGNCLVSMAEQNGMKYLAVILKSTAEIAPNTQIETVYSFRDAKDLFEWVFKLYAYQKVVNKKKLVANVKIELSANTDTIGLVPENDIEAMLPVNVDLENDIITTYKTYDDKLFAPIEKGDEMGELTVSYKDKVLGTVKLLANDNVERSNVLFVLEQIKLIINRKWFQAGVITFLIFLVFYISVYIINANKKAKRRFR